MKRVISGNLKNILADAVQTVRHRHEKARRGHLRASWVIQITKGQY